LWHAERLARALSKVLRHSIECQLGKLDIEMTPRGRRLKKVTASGRLLALEKDRRVGRGYALTGYFRSRHGRDLEYFPWNHLQNYLARILTLPSGRLGAPFNYLEEIRLLAASAADMTAVIAIALARSFARWCLKLLDIL
jgi:hypothetical protein